MLTVRNFDAPVNEFGAELRRTFALVRRDSIRHLIIDLRENNGGDSRNGDALQSYVEDSLYPAFAVVETKITPETKALYRSLLPPALHWVPLRWFVPMLRDIDRRRRDNSCHSIPMRTTLGRVVKRMRCSTMERSRF